jgi:HD-GYP domain-containing protein (c-di-GMP phosphodiesterase class II)
MDRSFFNQTNDHCINHLIETSETRPITVGEDIYDQKGVKLLARGQSIGRPTRERLLARTLRKPLEASLHIDEGLRGEQLGEMARQMFAEHPTIAALAAPYQEQIADLLGAQQLSGPTQLLMTAIAERDPGSLLHSVITAAISASLALRLRLTETVVVGAVTSGLLHDLGEFYVDPAVLGNEQDLRFDQWTKVAVHPQIGALFLSEFSDLPAFISRAVQEHHERLDGSGYPAGVSGGGMSELGQILMVAEVLAAVLPRRQNPQASALLAMRLVPGQFASQLIATLSSVFDERAESSPPSLDLQELKTAAQDINTRLRFSSVESRRLSGDRALSAPHKLLAEQSRELCARLIASLHSTGVVPLLEQASTEDIADPTIALELQVVTTELKWRMRALARHIALAANIGDRSDSALSPLVAELYGSATLCTSGDDDPNSAHRTDRRAEA